MDLVIRLSVLPPRESLLGDADHFGIPELGFRPRVADPELITRVGGWKENIIDERNNFINNHLVVIN